MENDDNSNEDSTRPPLNPVRLSSVPAERISWCWPHRIAFGKLALLDGDPGLGKSTLIADLAARVTTGRPFPGGETTREPANALLVLMEDGLSDTVRPRLEALGADLDRVHCLGPETPVTLPEDMEQLAEIMEREHVKLLVLDPLRNVLSCNMGNDHDVREALGPLTALASKTGAAIVVVRHLTKGGSRVALYRGGGSIAVIGAARTALLLGKDPDDPQGRVLAVTKSNLGPIPPSLKLKVISAEGDVARLEYVGESAYSADNVLTAAVDSVKRSAFDEATAFLREFLANGPAHVNLIKKAATEAGHAWATVKAAKMRLGVESNKRKAANGAWVWELPPSGEQNGPARELPPEFQATPRANDNGSAPESGSGVADGREETKVANGARAALLGVMQERTSALEGQSATGPGKDDDKDEPGESAKVTGTDGRRR